VFFFSLVGSTSGVCTIFVFPCMFAYYTPTLPFRWPFITACIILTGVIGVGGTTMTIIDNFF